MKNPLDKKQRLILPDILKGIAVVLMIQVHLMENFASPEVYASWLGKISLFLGGPPAAPVFMALMGFFIAFSGKSFRVNITRGFKLIVLGIVLNIGLNLHLLILIMNGAVDHNPWHYVFGVDILFVAGLSIILITLLSKVLKENLAGWAVMVLLFASLNPWLPVYSGQTEWIKYVQAFFWGNSGWSYFPVFPWFAYPLTGYIFSLLMKKYEIHKISETNKLYAAAAALLAVVVTFSYGFQTTILLTEYYHHAFTFFLWTIAFLLCWLIFADLLFKKAENHFLVKYLVWTGKNVTTFYVIQWLIIGNVSTYLFQTQRAWQFVMWFLLILLTVSVFVLLFNKLKEKFITKKSNI